MKDWTLARCRCGAEWRWYGPASEAAALERLWWREHGRACPFVAKAA